MVGLLVAWAECLVAMKGDSLAVLMESWWAGPKACYSGVQRVELKGS